MTYTISKRFDFSAGHQLRNLPPEHQCARLHGHNYQIEVTLIGEELDETGFIRDYGELKTIKAYLDGQVEHKHLNDVFEFNPTAENLAKHFHDTFKEWHPEVVSVSVKETDKTSATYSSVFGNMLSDFQKVTEELAKLIVEETNQG